jgi:hypothetical protein
MPVSTSALGGATAITHDNQLFHNLSSVSNAPSQQSLIPTLQDFRADPTLVSQATRQLSELDDDNMGRCPSNNVANRLSKRGLARLGGENSPIIQIPWPHDYVLGLGKNIGYTTMICLGHNFWKGSPIT